VSATRSIEIEAEAARLLLANLKDVLAGDEDATLSTIEGETGLFEAIDEATARVLEIGAMQDAIGARMDSLKARMARLDAQSERIRTCIAVAMETAELKKLERPEATLSLGKKAATAVITNEADIPAEFWKPSDPKLDKKALLAALKDKREIPGATLSNGGTTLSIRKG
jgi:hypothetical protein